MFSGLRSKMKERRVKRLLRELQSNTAGIKYLTAAMALGRLRDPRVVEPLIQALKHPNCEVRYVAAVALGEIGDARAIDPLVEALADHWGSDELLPSVREAAAIALAKLGEVEWKEIVEIDDFSHGLERLAESGDPRLLTPLLRASRDPHSSGVRADAAAALGKLGDPRAVQLLIAATMDDDWEVRSHAFEALGELKTDEGFEFLVGEAEEGSHCAVGELAKYGDVRGTDAVVELIDHCERWRTGDAYWLFRALGKIGGERAFQRLKQEVEGGEPEAIWPLAKTGDPRAVDVLIQRLSDHDAATITDSDAVGVANAAGGLAKLGDPRAVEPLIDALKNNRKPPVTAEDFYHAESRRKRMLLRVIKALGELGDSRAIAEVQKLTKGQPNEIEEEADWALGKLDSKRRKA
ncbi:MAG: HEAT repeat domain-containing protein [Gemmatimonadales bacterium]